MTRRRPHPAFLKSPTNSAFRLGTYLAPCIPVTLRHMQQKDERMQPQTVLRVSIPVADTPACRADAPVILVVTGDSNLREAASRVLSLQGYRVLTAAHAGHAVLACLQAGRVDLLAAELSMDDVSGPALAERLRRHCPMLSAVYFANSGTPECEGVIVRPFTRDDLLESLAAAAQVAVSRP